MEAGEIKCPKYGIIITEEERGRGVAAFLAGYKGTEIIVPEEVDGLKIVGLRFVNFRAEIRTIHLSKTVEFVSFEYIKVGARRLDIKIDKENPYLQTDGKAVYTKDGVLVRFFAGGVSEYKVLDGTRVIGELAFWGASKLQKVMLPNGLVKIGMRAFLELAELREINLPDTLRFLGRKAFLGCECLEALHLPSSLEAIGEEAFLLCYKLREITVDPRNPYFTAHNGILYTKDRSMLLYAPSGAVGETFEVPSFVRMIGDRAFYCVHDLKKVILPPSVFAIEKSAFEYCYDLLEINLENVRFIEDSAFRYCTHINISELNCEELGDHAIDSMVKFLSIRGLKSLGEETVPEAVELILFDDIDYHLIQRLLSESRYVNKVLTMRSHETGELLYRLSTMVYVDNENFEDFLSWFKPSGLDFAKYDAYWEKLFAEDDPNHEVLLTYAAYFRITYPRCLSENTREIYLSVLSRNTQSLLGWIIKENKREYLSEFFDLGIINERNAVEVISCSTELHDPEITAFLLELKNKYFPNISDDLDLE